MASSSRPKQHGFAIARTKCEPHIGATMAVPSYPTTTNKLHLPRRAHANLVSELYSIEPPHRRHLNTHRRRYTKTSQLLDNNATTPPKHTPYLTSQNAPPITTRSNRRHAQTPCTTLIDTPQTRAIHAAYKRQHCLQYIPQTNTSQRTPSNCELKRRIQTCVHFSATAPNHACFVIKSGNDARPPHPEDRTPRKLRIM